MPVNAGSKSTTSLDPAPRAPVALEWNATVHAVVAPAVCTAAENNTGAGEVAAAITTSLVGDTWMASALVLTLKPDLSYVLAAGLVIPAMWTGAPVRSPTAQVPRACAG